MLMVIEKLGGWEAATAALCRRGLAPTSAAMKKWRQRGLPARVRFALASECAERGIAFALRHDLVVLTGDRAWERARSVTGARIELIR